MSSSWEIFVLSLLLLSTECRKYKLSCPTDCWPNKIASCNNQGERERTYRYSLPHLSSINLKFHHLNFMTSIRAKFSHLILKTNAVKKSDVTFLVLNTYENIYGTKEYSKTYGFMTPCDDSDRCEQAASVNVTLRIYRGGAVVLELGVNAASFHAESCASSKVCVENFVIKTKR